MSSCSGVLRVAGVVGVLGATVGLAAPGRAQPSAEPALGAVHFPVSCASTVQPEFDRAVGLLHHMMYVEAQQAFEAIAAREPRCAMAQWGVAMTLFQPLWPTRPTAEALARGRALTERASALPPGTEREREKHPVTPGSLPAGEALGDTLVGAARATGQRETARTSYETLLAVTAPDSTRPEVVEARAFLQPADGAARSVGCAPVGEIQFICDVIGPEDIAVVPDSEWIIVSGNQEGGRLHLVNVSQKTTRVLFPSASNLTRQDRETYPGCRGPIDPAEGDAFRAHGLYLKPGEGDAAHTLHVVHHGLRESIEVFEVDAADATPSLTWVGCAVAPEGATFNAVVALPDGGIAATATRLAGDITSGVLEWHTDSGWTMVPGSENIRPNGLEISDDGDWFYVAGWVDERFNRLSRGRTPVELDVVPIGFRPDNVRKAPDGLIYAAGHTDFQEPTEAFNVARIDPETLAFERILQHPVIDGFAAATAAVPIGPDIWLGTNRGEKIGYVPAPRLNKIIERFERGQPALANDHWRILSLEHSPFLVDDLEAFLHELESESAGRPRLTPIVRIPHEADQDYHHVVKQLLDAGAMGIVLPQVRTADEVTRLVRAMRYPPQRGAPYPDPRGRRGWGPTAAMRVWRVTADEYARTADVWPLNPEGELLAIAMVETREIVDNIDEILQVPGLGGLLIGPADLSLSLGVGTPAANPGAPEVQEAIATVGAACRRHNALCGIYTRVDIETATTQGFNLFPVP